VDQKQIAWLTGVLWLLSQIVAFVALEERFLLSRVCFAMVTGVSCLTWFLATRGMKHEDPTYRSFVSIQLPVWFDTILWFLFAFGVGSEQGSVMRSFIGGVMFVTCVYPLVGVVVLVVRMTKETGLAATAAVRGAALHAHLQSRGYQELSLADCASLWRLCGEAAFLLPPWEHCGVLPEVNEGDLESLARVARSNRGARGRNRDGRGD
jgi:hypothetical protein